MCVITTVSAQNYDDATIKSVRGGLTLSQIYVSGLHTQSDCGFSIELNVQQTLSDTYPIYLGTGIGLNLKKFGELLLLSDLSGDSDDSYYKPRYMFLCIPLMVNYKFFTNDDFVVYPSVGFALQVGLSEKYGDVVYHNEEYKTIIESNNIFDGSFDLIDVPLRLGITAEFKQKYIINYTHESGMVFNDTSSDNINGFIKSNYITLGIRF